MSKFLFLGILMSSLFAMANSAVSDDKQCGEDDPTTYGMSQCISEKISKEEEKLAAILNQVSTRLNNSHFDEDKEILRRLMKSQQTWQAYREANCEFEGVEMLGGSGEGIVVLGCIYRMTEERVRSLQDMMPVLAPME